MQLKLVGGSCSSSQHTIKIINAEVLLQKRDLVHTAKVLHRSIGTNGTIASQYKDDPGLNYIVYDVEFPNDTIKEYSGNVIAENILTQIDDDVLTMLMMQGIIDHKTGTVSKCDMYAVTRCGRKNLRKIIYDWNLLVKQKDESES